MVVNHDIEVPVLYGMGCQGQLLERDDDARLRSFIEEVIHPCAESDDRKDQEDESHVNILVDDGVPVRSIEEEQCRNDDGSGDRNAYESQCACNHLLLQTASFRRGRRYRWQRRC